MPDKAEQELSAHKEPGHWLQGGTILAAAAITVSLPGVGLQLSVTCCQSLLCQSVRSKAS